MLHLNTNTNTEKIVRCCTENLSFSSLKMQHKLILFPSDNHINNESNYTNLDFEIKLRIIGCFKYVSSDI
jgi:hypothetical protein